MDDLVVDSFTTAADVTAADMMVEIGYHETGCIAPCEPAFTAGFC